MEAGKKVFGIWAKFISLYWEIFVVKSDLFLHFILNFCLKEYSTDSALYFQYFQTQFGKF